MHTIMIDGSDYSDPRDVYLALKRMLCLPEYFGLNADALNDCLSERRDPVSLWILSPGSGDVSRTLSVIQEVVAVNGGTVKEL